MTINEKRIERLRELIEQVGNAQAAGLIDDQGDPELVEMTELVTELDRSGCIIADPVAEARDFRRD